MVERRVSIRLVAEGGKVVEQEFRSAAEAERHLRRLTDATGPANAGLKAIDATAREMRGNLEGLTASLGPLGRVAAALGPIGIAIGAAAGGLALLGRQGAAAAREIAAVGDAADRLQIDPETFERLSAALTLQGQGGNGLEQAIRTLQQRIGEARSGVKSAADEFARIGVSLGGDFEGTLDEVADAFARIEDPAQRAAVANRLFGESGGALVTVLGQGREGFAQLSAEAERLGLVYGGPLIRDSQRMSAELDTQHRIIETRLNAGLAGFAGLWLSVSSAIAEAQLALSGFLERFLDIQNVSLGELERQITVIDNRLSRMGEISGRPEDLFNDQQIENLRAERAELVAMIEARNAWRPSSGNPSSSMTITTPASGGSTPPNAFEGAIEQANRQILQLEQQAETFGMTREAAEAYRLEQALLAAAQEQYGVEAPFFQQAIESHVEAYEAAAGRVAILREAQEQQTRAAQVNQRAMEAAGQTIVTFAGELERSERPMQTFIRLAAQLALSTAFGQGPFGAVLNTVLGVAAGGVLGLAGAGANATAAPAGYTPAAASNFGLPVIRPAAFGADLTVPGYGGLDSRRMAFDLTPGERVRITRPGDRMQQGSGQTVIVNASTTVNVTAAEAEGDPATLGQTIAAMVDARVISTLRDQMRPGGALQPVFAA